MTFWLTQIVLAYFKSPSDEPGGRRHGGARKLWRLTLLADAAGRPVVCVLLSPYVPVAVNCCVKPFCGGIPPIRAGWVEHRRSAVR